MNNKLVELIKNKAPTSQIEYEIFNIFESIKKNIKKVKFPKVEATCRRLFDPNDESLANLLFEYDSLLTKILEYLYKNNIKMIIEVSVHYRDLWFSAAILDDRKQELDIVNYNIDFVQPMIYILDYYKINSLVLLSADIILRNTDGLTPECLKSIRVTYDT